MAIKFGDKVEVYNKMLHCTLGDSSIDPADQDRPDKGLVYDYTGEFITFSQKGRDSFVEPCAIVQKPDGSFDVVAVGELFLADGVNNSTGENIKED
jgi:hypothetical protein